MFLNKKKVGGAHCFTPTGRSLRYVHITVCLCDIAMRIFVETQNSETISLNLEEEDTVRAVKERIMLEKRIPVEEQTLRYNGKELDNNETLEKYGIYRDATLQLIVDIRRSITL